MQVPSAEDVACKVLEKHKKELEETSSRLVSLITCLKQVDLQSWRRDGHDLVDWMNGEADDMARIERDLAITKVTGGSAAIAGGVMAGVGLVASFYTFGLAAPLAIGGLALGGAGAATSAGGDVAQLSIVPTKTLKIKEKCEAFAQRTDGVLRILLEIRMRMSEISKLCEQNNAVSSSGVIQIVLKCCMNAVSLGKVGMSVKEIGQMTYNITKLQRSGVILGEDFLKLAAQRVGGVGGSISRALLKGAGVAVNIGFGIWDVVEGSGTLHNGGSHASLIRANASQLDNTIAEIEKALHELHL